MKKKRVPWHKAEEDLIAAYVGIAAIATGTPLNIRECLERVTLALNATFHKNKDVRTFHAVEQRYYSKKIKNQKGRRIFGHQNIKNHSRFKNKEFPPTVVNINGKKYLLEVNFSPLGL